MRANTAFALASGAFAGAAETGALAVAAAFAVAANPWGIAAKKKAVPKNNEPVILRADFIAFSVDGILFGNDTYAPIAVQGSTYFEEKTILHSMSLQDNIKSKF
jgi:hypothetical protein